MRRNSKSESRAQEAHAAAVHVRKETRAPGKQSLVQRRYAGAAPARRDTDSITQTAADGVRGSGGGLPHFEQIQTAFGRHDVSGVRAHVGGPAEEAAAAIRAEAYSVGNDVAFSRPPSLHTAAHEAAHAVQQRAGVAFEGGLGQVDDEHEQHADAVADRVVRGESAEDLLDQRAGSGARSSRTGPQRRAIQRKPVDTHFGTFDDETFEELEVDGKKVGMEIHLTFDPGPSVDATKIGMVQAVRSFDRGSPEFLDDAKKQRAVPEGPGAGYSIDRLYGNTNPVYGAENQESGGLEATPESSASKGTTPHVGGKHWNTNYILGHCYETDAGVEKQKAEMYDRPKLPERGANAGQEFETTALALDGKQKDTYYGSVRWGWRTDDKGNFSPIPLVKCTDGAPDATFDQAAALWNKQQFLPGVGAPDSQGWRTTSKPIDAVRARHGFRLGAGAKLRPAKNMKPVNDETCVNLASSFPIEEGNACWTCWLPEDKLEGDVVTEDTATESSGEAFTLAANAQVKRTTSKVGNKLLVFVVSGVVKDVAPLLSQVWVKTIDITGGETIDLPTKK